MLNPNPNENIASDIGTHKVHVTFFKDIYAKTVSVKAMTLAELANHINTAIAPTKEMLPWLKLAKFGDIRTDKACLRHDANVTGIDGVELDYDSEEMSFDEVVATLKRMGVCGIIYTTPSHTAAGPRWRVLLPTSTTLPIDQRILLAARVNGFFGCIFKPESFVLSQSFYYGKAKDNPAPDHRVQVIDGQFVDLQIGIVPYETVGMPTDTDAPNDKSSDPFTQYGDSRPQQGRGFDIILAELGDSPPGPLGLKGFHQVLRDAVASYASKNKDDFDRKILKDILREAINAAPKNNSAYRKKTIERYLTNEYLDDIIKSGIKKFGQQAQAQEAFSQQQQTAYGQSSNTRPQLPLPAKDGPWLPVMNKLDEVLGASSDTKPPCRDIDGFMVVARKVVVPKTHAYQDETDETTKSELPPPEQWMLSRQSENQLAELIEQHINFVNFKKQPVHLQAPFVKHYHQRHDSPLPIAVAIVLSPIVLADGGVLAGKGLDRASGTIFEIPKQLLDNLPRREDCTPAAVTKAMQFLCDDWLCDVNTTDQIGKATIIAAAMTIIERTLLPNRPSFVIKAGRRGGGKSTVIEMLIMAVNGIKPAAAAWSESEEERRKTLMAQFISGVSYILWDNIKRGAQIACPHIERACTATFYTDRRLGVSEMVNAAASAIHFFTGNNIGLRSVITRSNY